MDTAPIWTVAAYGSGTTGVHRLDVRAPHFYVYEAPGIDRYETCEQLAAWLNGTGPRQPWMDALIRSGEALAHHPAVNAHGAILPVYVTGPCVESEPGRGDWVLDPAFKDERAELMDRLFQINAPTGGETGGG
jgi:hypothetical protein